MQLQNATHTLFAPCKPPLCEQLEKPNGFCFHAQKVPMTPLLQRISAFSGLDRYEVNYAYLTLSPKAMRQPHPELPEGAVAGRIVSFPKRVKKGFNYFVCTPEGLIVAFAARFLPETTTKGGRLPHGTLVTVER